MGHHPIRTDITDYAGHLDVTNEMSCKMWARTTKPEFIYHLAGAKYATDGEVDPVSTTRVNIDGTRNIVQAAGLVGARVILASTCKAANPETVYGASKLIAERIVLNSGGTVVRFFNVPETVGNVFRLWEGLDESEPIPFTDCFRFFVPLEKILDTLVRALWLPPGRYAPDPGLEQHMMAVARKAYPERKLQLVSARRGDRLREPLRGSAEQVVHMEGMLKIESAHD